MLAISNEALVGDTAVNLESYRLCVQKGRRFQNEVKHDSEMLMSDHCSASVTSSFRYDPCIGGPSLRELNTSCLLLEQSCN
jgi:hypothetical protein